MEPGQQVVAGDVLVRSRSPELGIQIRVLQAQLAEFEAKHQASRFRDRTASHIFAEEIIRIKGELQEAKRQQDMLVLRSPAADIFQMPNHQDMPGRYLMRSDILAYLVNPGRLSIRGLVAQDDIDRVRIGVLDIHIRFASGLAFGQVAHIAHLVPAASHDLPSLALALALGVESGGRVALDPSARNDPQAFARHYQYELRAEGRLPVERIGERDYVRFAHSAEPLGFRLFRQVRRIFLRQLGV